MRLWCSGIPRSMPWPLRWRHNGRDGVSNHQPYDCLLNRLFRRGSKKTSKLRVAGLCSGNSPQTGEFSAQRASSAENVSIWWRHHGCCDPVATPSVNILSTMQDKRVRGLFHCWKVIEIFDMQIYSLCPELNSVRKGSNWVSGPSKVTDKNTLLIWSAIFRPNHGLYSLRGRASNHNISWSIEATRFRFRLFQSLRNLAGTSAAALLSFQHPISRLRDLTRFVSKTWIEARDFFCADTSYKKINPLLNAWSRSHPENLLSWK